MKDDSRNAKELILTLLKDKNLSFSEMKSITGFEKKKMVNYLCSLKTLQMITVENKAQAENPQKLKYIRISDKTYTEVYIAKKALATNNKPNNYKVNPDFLPYASMKHSCDDYHTSGNPHRVSAWQGYSSL